jgi:hypothetical protein
MRFYKPRLREYVSTQVDMPWEFLQGVAEQKQKGYDDALATGDAANKLLNFEVIPGDMEGKQAIQQEYNELLYGITDYVRQTGDFNTASREFSKVIRNIAQDKRIQIMTNAVPVHKEVMKSANQLLEKGASFGVKADPMFRTYDPATGELRPYNQSAGYNNIEVNDQFRRAFENLLDNAVASGGGSKKPTADGQYYVTSKGEALTQKQLAALVKPNIGNLLNNYSRFVKDLNDIDVMSGLQSGTTINNMINSVINERVYSKSYTDYDYTEDWVARQKEKREQESTLGVFTGAGVNYNFDYGKTKEEIKTNYDRIAALEKSLNDPAATEYTKNGIRQQISALKSENNRKELMLGAAEKDSGEKLWTEYLAEFNLTPEQYNSLSPMEKSIKTTLQFGTKDENNRYIGPPKLFTKEEFFSYIKDEKQFSEYNSSAKGSLDLYRNKFEEKSQESARTGVMVNEYSVVTDFKENSSFNKTSKKILEGVINGTISATTLDGYNLNKQLEGLDIDESKSSIEYVRENATGNSTYIVDIVTKDGKHVKHIIDLPKSDASIKNIVQSGVVTAMNNTSNEQTLITGADVLANNAFGNDLTVLRDYDVNNKVLYKPIKVGNYFVINATDNYGKAVPGQYLMTQGRINNNGDVELYNAYEKNPNADTYILSYGDITSKLGFEVYSTNSGRK